MNAYLQVIGIFGGKPLANDIEISMIYGTASKISETKFITAAHVLVSCMEHESFGVLFKYPDEKIVRIKEIHNVQLYKSTDIATFDCDLPHIYQFQLEENKLPLLADVESLGFPYGLESQDKIINLRAFKGYITGNQNEFTKLDGRPSISELSFHCPRGLSGAPVFSKSNKIAGIVIGNNISEMTIYSEKEKTIDGNEVYYEKTESMHMGVMVRSEFILKMKYI